MKMQFSLVVEDIESRSAIDLQLDDDDDFEKLRITREKERIERQKQKIARSISTQPIVNLEAGENILEQMGSQGDNRNENSSVL